MAYPETPGYSDRGASRAAAEKIKPRVKSLRRQMYDFVREKPRTDYEVERHFGRLNQTTTARMSELRQMGLLEDTGRRRPAESGEDAAEWRVLEDVDYDAAEKMWKETQRRRPKGNGRLERLEAALDALTGALHDYRP